jgi:hypothetical protein
VKNPRFKYLKPNPQALGVVPLEKGEASKPIRIRAPKALFERLSEFTPKEIGELLELGLLEQQALSARNAVSRHYTLEEAQALIGRRVRVVQGNAQQRAGQTSIVHTSRQVRSGEGYELELNDGVILTRRQMLNAERYELLES